MSADDLRSLVGDIKRKIGLRPRGGGADRRGRGDRGAVRGGSNPAAQDPGLRNDLIKQIATAVDGRGGGKADLAQGSGKDPGGIDAALAALRAEIARS